MVRVQQRADGFYIVVEHDGHVDERWVGDRERAERAAAELRRRFGVLTFADYVELWRTEYATQLSPQTVTNYNTYLKNHILPRFGKCGIEEIDRASLKAFVIKNRDSGLAASSCKQILFILSGIFRHAIEDGRVNVPINPAKGLGRFLDSKENKSNIPDPYKRDELFTYLETICTEYPFYYPLFLTLSTTGIRLGEALAIQRADVLFENDSIIIRRSLDDKNRAFTTTKNGESRNVSLDPKTAKVLTALIDERKPARDGLIFTNTKGRRLSASNLRVRVHYAAIEKAGLRKIRIHDLRHTYATIWISEGRSIAKLAKLLGHKDVNVTHKTYSHWMPNESEDMGFYELLTK